jgi:hypothetical protein
MSKYLRPIEDAKWTVVHHDSRLWEADGTGIYGPFDKRDQAYHFIDAEAERLAVSRLFFAVLPIWTP